MKTIGVKELRRRLSQVLREVEETRGIVAVSNRGRIVAHLVPPPTPPKPSEKREPRIVIAELDALAAEISAGLTEPVDVAALINDIRR